MFLVPWHEETETSFEVFRQKSGKMGFPPTPYKVYGRCFLFVCLFNLEILPPQQLCNQQYLRRDAGVREAKAERCLTGGKSLSSDTPV